MRKRKKQSSNEVNIHEAKTHLSALLRRVAQGQQVTIANRGVPVAMLVPVKKPVSFLGIDRDRLKVPEDFNEPLPAEILAAFWGGDTPDRNKAK